MHRIVGTVLLLLPALPAAGAEHKTKDTAADQYRALVKQYDDGIKAFQEAYRSAKTPQEYGKAREKWPEPDKLAHKFVEMAERNAKDPAALDSLLWVVNNSRAQGKDSPRAKAVGVLSRDWVESPKIGPACLALARSFDTPAETFLRAVYLALAQEGFDKPTESFLRAVLDKNPSRDAQGAACLALAEYVKNRVTIAEALNDRPQSANNFESMLGKDCFQELMKLDEAKAIKEAEDLYERASDKYGDVKVNGRTVADVAKPELFELRHLAVGKGAPDIKGEDIDGKKFKLSDYRGKVVLLDFWGNW